ncbi:hypothetical protein FQR65_LT18379 [Abscondita terminalis]|nr:hypothetical protein FQR65_LT18379 [Abscondita terminalis]
MDGGLTQEIPQAVASYGYAFKKIIITYANGQKQHQPTMDAADPEIPKFAFLCVWLNNRILCSKKLFNQTPLNRCRRCSRNRRSSVSKKKLTFNVAGVHKERNRIAASAKAEEATILYECDNQHNGWRLNPRNYQGRLMVMVTTYFILYETQQPTKWMALTAENPRSGSYDYIYEMRQTPHNGWRADQKYPRSSYGYGYKHILIHMKRNNTNWMAAAPEIPKVGLMVMVKNNIYTLTATPTKWMAADPEIPRSGLMVMVKKHNFIHMQCNNQPNRWRLTQKIPKVGLMVMVKTFIHMKCNNQPNGWR